MNSVASLAASAASAAGIQGFSTHEAHVRFTEVTLHNLPNADLDEGTTEGSSDPYIIFTIRCGKTTYKGRSVTLQDAGRTAKWEGQLAIKIPPDLALEKCTLHVTVMDEDKGTYDENGDEVPDDVMGSLDLMSLTGQAGLELDGEEFSRLSIAGEGKLHSFQISFNYEVFIPGLSKLPPPTEIAGEVAASRTLLRFKSVARAVYLGGGAGARPGHRLPFRHVQLPRARPDATLPSSADPGEAFDAFEYVNDVHGCRRAAGRLAIVTHPLGHSGLCNVETAATHAATLPLHHKLIERGWNVLAYEAHALSDSGSGKTEVAKLRAAMAYCAKHPQLRYCRISLFAQGTGACAAFMALHDHPEEFGYIVQLVSACEPTGNDDLTEGVISTYAPKCSVPVLLSHRPPSASSFKVRVEDGSPQQRPPTRLKPLAAARGVSMARRVADCLPSTTPSRTVLVHNYPLRGAARCIEGSRFLGDHPEQLFPFLEHHSSPMQMKLAASRGRSLNARSGAAQLSGLRASQSAPLLRPPLGSEVS